MAASASAFIAEVRAMEDNLNAMPPELKKIVCTLFTVVEEQAANIETLLATNKKLLDIIDVLRREG